MQQHEFNAQDNPAPLYHRIFNVLREKILEGVYRTDEAMPGEMELAATFGVSRATIRRTLDKLQQEGLVLRRQGAGTFVRSDLASKPMPGDLDGFIDNLLAFGLRTKVRVLEFRYLEAPDEIARVLELKEGGIVQKAVRLRSYKGQPFSLATTFAPERIGRTFSKKELTNERLLTLLIRASGGVASAHQRITARSADPQVAQLLEIEYGSPLMCITRVVRDAERRPINHIRALYRPDLYEFSLDLSTNSTPEGTVWQPSQRESPPDEP